MAKIKKDIIDFDTTLVELTFILKGRREILKVHTTASQCMNFIDVLNENRFKNFKRKEKEMMENRFYVFDDYKKKSTILINLLDIKYCEIPFFVDSGKEWDFKVLQYKR